MSTELMILLLRIAQEALEDERRVKLLEALVDSFEWEHP